jgi:hypothetical protein
MFQNFKRSPRIRPPDFNPDLRHWGQEYYNIGLAHPKLLLPYIEWATMQDEGQKLPN